MGEVMIKSVIELTPTHLTQLRLYALGDDYKTMTAKLHYSVDASRAIGHNFMIIRRVLNARNNVHAVYIATKLGLIK